ncbi:MAG TPA: glycerophosphodiester phosphodiesterase family protein [Allosphingosinicella sp.]|jgi:glycerophosphoryl diester phosphodiesterase
MKGRKRWIGIGIAGAAVALSLLNASWIAPTPSGKLILVAHRGIAQPLSEDAGTGPCAATRIRAPEDNLYIENTLPALNRAARLGAGAIAGDVQRTRDGHLVLFADRALDCRTNGKGPLRDKTLAELKALDVGYGYTPDNGKTYPLRGRGIGGMPTVEEALREVSSKRLIFNFLDDDAADADALLAAFSRTGLKLDTRYGFHGAPAPLARLKTLAPQAWTFSRSAPGPCLADYTKLGWTGFVPGSCRGATVSLPLDAQWTLWGWPNRFQSRMASADARLIMFGPAAAQGITAPEQLDAVPRDYRGYLWIEDFYTVGRALGR